jgi:hypothetical protein
MPYYSLVPHATTAVDTWTVVNMTAAKFKLFVFPVSGFALSNRANIFVFMILYDFCMMPAWFCYIIVNLRNLESHMQIADRYAPRKTANGANNLVHSSLLCNLIRTKQKTQLSPHLHGYSRIPSRYLDILTVSCNVLSTSTSLPLKYVRRAVA